MDGLKALDAEGVELDYRIPAPFFPPLKDALRRAAAPSQIAASSAQNAPLLVVLC